MNLLLKILGALALCAGAFSLLLGGLAIFDGGRVAYGMGAITAALALFAIGYVLSNHAKKPASAAPVLDKSASR